jgi:hypothetical protein
MKVAHPAEECRDLLGVQHVGLLLGVRLVLGEIEVVDRFGREMVEAEL